jgi:leader peptidase (prepilin peptidase) / N-methyltransferase
LPFSFHDRKFNISKDASASFLFFSAKQDPVLEIMMINAISSFEAITGLPIAFGYVLLFVFGAAVGSFLNVVIHRVPREQSIVFPNSNCPKCGTAIRAYDNIPILSWLMLRGRCRGCNEPIALRYPAVELLTGALWLLVFWQVGFTPMLPAALAFVSAIVALMFIDAEHMILPNVITYPFFLIVILLRVIFPIAFAADYFGDMANAPMAGLAEFPRWIVSLAAAGLGALAGGGSLWLVGEVWKRLRGVEAMGLGDVKMMLGVGAFIGWRLSFLTIFFAAFTGAIVGIVFIAMQKDRTMQARIPFGIFLGIGAIVCLLFGDAIIAWYVNSFVP